MTKQQLLARQAELRASLDAKLADFQALAATKPPTEDDWKPYNEQKAEFETVQSRLASIEKLEAETLAAAGRAAFSGGRVTDNRASEPFRSLGEQLIAIANASLSNHSNVDPRLQSFAPSGANQSTPADGGYLVQSKFSDQLLEKIAEEAVLAPLCDGPFPIEAGFDSLKTPYIDETSRADGSRWGGVQVYWRGEAEAVTATKPKFGEMKTDLNELMGLAYATKSLLSNARAMERVFTQAFGEEFSIMIDNGIFDGNGVGKLLGIKTSPAHVSVAKETSQVAATIVYPNILKMAARMPARSMKRAVWIANKDIDPQLHGMQSVIKNVAGTENVGGSLVYLPPGGLSAQPYGLLLGRPVIYTEQNETLGTKGDIALVDLSQYMLINRAGVGLEAASSMHVLFTTAEMTFRWMMEIGGQPKWKAPLTPRKGTATMSPFVFLDTRA